MCFHSSVAEILQTILLKDHLLHWFYNFIVEKSRFIICPQLNNMKVLLIFSYSTTLYWLPHKVFWESLMQFVSLPFWGHKFFRWSHLKFFTSFQIKYGKTYKQKSKRYSWQLCKSWNCSRKSSPIFYRSNPLEFTITMMLEVNYWSVKQLIVWPEIKLKLLSSHFQIIFFVWPAKKVVVSLTFWLPFTKSLFPPIHPLNLDLLRATYLHFTCWYWV